ncbi:hypothetical protein H6G89_13270 [Oscillatoria sp. FACHB-1407]|uniref:P-loop NTPase fold protein n=1 Tax=Oscillatoria sp. FACHB-1407 TaxID=2692847 RepID=UPI001687F0AA|nr:P-loop NTPase fold protein [Oscillatoria sp. FACHB-1407]MBD2462019.1 hypothetical protein [Oscillatoria sp. FACHB-1407]
MLSAPYISRPAAEAFLSAIASALQDPAQSPVVFHVWGTGGVGKSTLLNKLIAEHPEAAIPAIDQKPVKFGETEGIDSPIELMGGVPNLLITSVRPPVVPLGKGDGDSRGLVATDLKHYRVNEEATWAIAGAVSSACVAQARCTQPYSQA